MAVVPNKPNVSVAIDPNYPYQNGYLDPNQFNFYTTGTTTAMPWTEWETVDYIIEDDETGEIYGITPSGTRVILTKHLKRQITNLIKNKLEEIIAEENPVESDLQMLAKYREMLNILIEEINLTKKYLEVAEEIVDQRSGLDHITGEQDGA